jgi:hypothetical protein
MLSAYIDIPTFQQRAYGITLSPYIGCNTSLASDVDIGATSIGIMSNMGYQDGKPIYILDGPNTEIVPTRTYADSILTLVVSTAYAHLVGTSVSTDGLQGSLAVAIIDASSWLENYCCQGTPQDRSLWSKSRTEILSLSMGRAYIDNRGTLFLSPHTWPITSVVSATLQLSGRSIIDVNINGAMISADRRTLIFPNMVASNALASSWRKTEAGIRLTYVAGFANGSVPYDIQRATAWIVQEFLAYSMNPTGAAELRQGDVMIKQRQGGNIKNCSADSIFLTQAKGILKNYRKQPFS